MTCQGNLFLLSGEEFARTKNGLDDTYNESIELNRLDWEKAWKERELVEYYQGLIALRKQLPGLCDKSADAYKRIHGMWTKPRALGFEVENSDASGTGKWEALYIVYNAGEKSLDVELPEGKWQVLADVGSSFKWKEEETVEGRTGVPMLSVLIAGQESRK